MNKKFNRKCGLIAESTQDTVETVEEKFVEPVDEIELVRNKLKKIGCVISEEGTTMISKRHHFEFYYDDVKKVLSGIEELETELDSKNVPITYSLGKIHGVIDISDKWVEDSCSNHESNIKEAFAKHKDFDIEQVEEGTDAWESGYRFVVPAIKDEYKKYFNTIEDAKKAIDNIVKYNKSADKELRPEFALDAQKKADKDNEYNSKLKKAYSILHFYADDESNLPPIDEFISNVQKSQDKLKAILNYAKQCKIKWSDVSDRDNDYILNLFTNPYPSVVVDPEGDGLEQGQYPWYVVHYNGGAVWEPAEGGYYVDVNTASSSVGFKTRPQAERYAKAWANELGLEKADKDNYKSEYSPYVGDHEAIVVESSKEYLKDTVRYDGYC